MDKESILTRCEDLLKDLDNLSIENNWGIISKQTKQNVDESEVRNIISFFEIEKKQEPIYMNINSHSDIDSISEIILNKIDDLRGTIGSLLATLENEISTSTEEATNAIFRIITNCSKVAAKQLRSSNFESDSTIDELRKQYETSIGRLLENRLIRTTMSSIYEGMKHGDISAYKRILNMINKFLQDIGVYTINIEINKEPNYDYIVPIQSENDVTNDYNLEGTVKEIYKYPYVFDTTNIISEGQVVIWRKE